jgi:hypothetical protein
MPDYTPGAATSVSPELKAKLQAQLTVYIGMMDDVRPPSFHSDDEESTSVFSGQASRALLFLKLHKHTQNASYLATSKQYIDEALKWTSLSNEKFTGFLWSKIGTFSLAAVIYSFDGQQSQAEDFISKVQAAFNSESGEFDDFDSGRAGLLFAARFLDKNMRGSPSKKSWIDRDSIAATATAIIDRGAALMTPDADYMRWHGPNDAGLWLGQSHGSAGVIQQLLEVSSSPSHIITISPYRHLALSSSFVAVVVTGRRCCCRHCCFPHRLSQDVSALPARYPRSWRTIHPLD